MNMRRSLGNNAPLLLAIISAAGVIGTALLVNKASPEAKEILKKESNEAMPLQEKVKLTWKCYAPAAVMGVTTIGCIFGSTAMSKRQQVVMASSYALVTSSYSKYKNKILEVLGKEKFDEVNKEVNKKDVTDESEDKLVKKLLFYDGISDRFFEAYEKDVLEAEYKLNRKYAIDHEVNLNSFYEFLDLEITDKGTEIGWSLDASEQFYGYDWIEFNHELCKKEDGTEYYNILMPYPPTEDFISMSDCPFDLD